jgi:ubiquinone/menaquinone biosynthesis C-methylase UbiE
MFQKRSYELERIDKGDYTLAQYEDCLLELQRVNRWLGDAWTLRRTLLRDLKVSGLRKASILDVGAGSGELLRVTSSWAGKNRRSLRLVGLELNPLSAQAILGQSKEFSSISAVRGNAFQLPFADGQFDFVISSLFTHHFTEFQIVTLLKEMTRVASREICIIDLHRHPIAYFFYVTIAPLILRNRLIQEDGALSILRSFKPRELLALGQRANLTNLRVERHFPFRLVLRAGPASAHVISSESSLSGTNQANQAA